MICGYQRPLTSLIYIQVLVLWLWYSLFIYNLLQILFFLGLHLKL